jgi:hypothetical protein
MPTTSTANTNTIESNCVADDFANCEQCKHTRDFYKRACATCDGTSEFIPYTPSRP